VEASGVAGIFIKYIRRRKVQLSASPHMYARLLLMTSIAGAGDRGSTVVKFCATNLKVAGSIPDGVIGFFR
jgi:hypothetical protein